jgi:hypothetical protein
MEEGSDGRQSGRDTFPFSSFQLGLKNGLGREGRGESES